MLICGNEKLGVKMHFVVHEDNKFCPLDRDALGWTDPMVVHRRRKDGARNLVLFVHGLGGRAYETWGRYPAFVFDDDPDLDVGLFDYESGHRRRFWRSISMEGHTDYLALAVRDLPLPYDRVVLVGHSMGGLMCKAAIRHLVNTFTHDSRGVLGADKVVGLVLFATPQAGSSRVPSILSRVNKDARALHANSNFVTGITQHFRDRIATKIDLQTPTDKQRIPTFAVIATGDLWVNPLSAGLDLTTDQQKVVMGSHRSITKPKDRMDDAYMWFRDQLGRCLTAASTKPHSATSDLAKASDEETLQRLMQAILRTSAEIDVPLHIKQPIDSTSDAPFDRDDDASKGQESP